MRVYDEFSALWRAPSFSRSFYLDVGLNWTGIGLRYLLLVQLICWLPIFLWATVSLSNFIDRDAKEALKEVPRISIHGGHVSSPADQPYIMKDEGAHPVFVLDTTGTIKSPAEVGARLLLTETTLVQVDGAGRVQTRPLAGFPDMDCDADWLIGRLRVARNLILPVAYPLTVLGGVAWRLVAALLLAVFGLILTGPFGARLSFAGLMRLAVMAMTTVMVLHTIVQLAGIPIWFYDWPIYPAISMGYMVFAVKVNGERVRGEEHSFPVEIPERGQG